MVSGNAVGVTALPSGRAILFLNSPPLPADIKAGFCLNRTNAPPLLHGGGFFVDGVNTPYLNVGRVLISPKPAGVKIPLAHESLSKEGGFLLMG